MSKEILMGKKARGKIKKGLDKVSDTVKVTLGSKGRNIIIHNAFGQPLITNDGVTIAKHIFLKDEFEELGAQLIKSVSWDTNERAGDGTTTATLLAQEITTMGMKKIDNGKNPIELQDELRQAKERVVDRLKEAAIKVETDDVAKIGTISSQDPKVGEIIAEILKKGGRESVISVEEGNKYGLSWTMVDGMEYDTGAISPYMLTEGEETRLKDPYVLVTDHAITNPADIGPLVHALSENDVKDFLIICAGMDGQALISAIQTKANGQMNIVAVQAPGIGDNRIAVLTDIAEAVNAKFISTEKGDKLSDSILPHLGRTESAVVGRSYFRLINGGGSVEERIKTLKKQVKECDDDFEKIRYEERLQKLQGGIGVIHIGAASDTELKEKLYRIEDAIHATKHAVNEGVVAGGGVALIDATHEMKIKNDGDEIIYTACASPIKQICNNAGIKVNEERISKGIGYDTDKGIYCDMMLAGIVDPVRVVINEIENATSVAMTLLTVEGAIVEEPGDDLTLDDLKKDL